MDSNNLTTDSLNYHQPADNKTQSLSAAIIRNYHAQDNWHHNLDYDNVSLNYPKDLSGPFMLYYAVISDKFVRPC